MLLDPSRFLQDNKAAEAVTHRMLAAFAALSYKSNKLPENAGIEDIDSMTDDPNGYDAHCVFHRASGTLIFVNRGMEGLAGIRDLAEGYKAAFIGDWRGPILSAASYFLSVSKKLQDKRSKGGVEWSDVLQIACTGHSWGAALAETQVAVGLSVLKEAQIPGRAVWGAGFGSAGFAEAIKAMSADKGWPIAADIHTEMDHYVRHRDPVRQIQLQTWETLGDVYWQPDIYVLNQRQSGSGPNKVPGTLYHIETSIDTSHDRWLYFQLWGQSPSQHFIHAGKGKFYLCDGEGPPPRAPSTVNPVPALIDGKRPFSG